MAFWGVEVKPGKPYTHSSNGGRGRLRISQATLAIGSSENKSLVQCNVGDKSPVLLCALLPDKTESLHLDLEFEEAEEVLFSVIGPRGVYLTGYYVGKSARSYFQDDTESFGEDIANSGSEESNHLSDDDKYEDSFINDDEPEVATSLSTSSGRVDDETMGKKKGRNGKGNRKRLKRRCQSVVSDDETSSKQQNTRSRFKIFTESDDEDNMLISSICKDKPEAAGRKSKKGTVPVDKKVKENDGGDDKKEADNAPVVGSVGKVDMEVIDDGTKRGFGITNDPEEDMKTKRKKKKHSKKDKDNEAKDGHLVSLKEDNRQQVETEADADTIYQDVLTSKDDQRPNSNLEINHLHGSSLLPADVPSEKSPKAKRKRKNRVEVKGDSKGNDLFAESEQDQKPRTNKSDNDSEQLTDENQSAEKKAKKKRRKKSRNEQIEGNTLK